MKRRSTEIPGHDEWGTCAVCRRELDECTHPMNAREQCHAPRYRDERGLICWRCARQNDEPDPVKSAQ